MIDRLQIIKSQVAADAVLSVLVRVKNERKALPEFWSRLSSQTIFPRLEVLFLDSGSTDGTLEFIEHLPVSLYRIRSEDFCFGTACNLLMSLSRAPIVSFLSGHVLLQNPDALERLHAALRGKDRAAAYLRQVPDEIFGASYYERAYLQRRYPDCKGKFIEMDRPGGFSWEGNPFPEIHGSEDMVWVEKHLALQGKLFYVSGVTAMHSHRDTATSTYNRVNSYARARAARGSYGKAGYYFAGVLFSMVRIGSPLSEAFQFAASHARAYLPQNLRSEVVSRSPTSSMLKAGSEDAALLKVK
jgi:glycosyltransferase involved in cell wall biosynthesis